MSDRLSRAHKLPVLRDQGTFEGQRKRAALINGASVELAARLPGILFANAHLDQDQFNAAVNYGRLHAQSSSARAWLNLCALAKPSAEGHGRQRAAAPRDAQRQDDSSNSGRRSRSRRVRPSTTWFVLQE